MARGADAAAHLRPYEPIRRDYAIEEYLGDIESSGIAQSVYVQANWAPARAVDEVAWVQAGGRPHGISPCHRRYADLRDPDVGEVLKTRPNTRCCAASVCSSTGTRTNNTASPMGLR